jgi:predicted nucleic acid-binding Zn ribbon protein
MGGRPFPEVHCVICRRALDLRTDLCADENGKALHSECYLKHIRGLHNEASTYQN